MSIRDTFALPRCKATAIHLPEGAWEYRVERDESRIAALVACGWTVRGPCGSGTLLKFTHAEKYP